MAKRGKTIAATNTGGLFSASEVEDVSRETRWLQAARATSSCRRCEMASANGCRGPIPGQGAFHRPWIAFLLEAPSPAENASGLVLPADSPTGALFDRMLQTLGIPRDKVLALYAVSCHSPSCAPPGETLLDLCAPNWEAQLAAAAPHVIVACGWAATVALLGESRALEEQVGAWRRCMEQEDWRYWRSVPWRAIHHPSSMVTAPRTRAETLRVLLSIGEWLERSTQGAYRIPAALRAPSPSSSPSAKTLQ